jgi:hypothetical protein
MIVSKKEFAERHGVKPETVRSWIMRGHLRPPALRPNGAINIEAADKMLANTLDRVRQAGSQSRRVQIDNVTSPTAPVVDFSDAASLLKSRAVMARITALERQHAFYASRGRYTLTEDAQREWRAVLAALITNIEGWFATLVEELGGDQGARHRNLIVIRKSWRRLRAREVERHRTEAADLPEFVADREAL